jgi:pyruvate dehydrogenase E1 component beta subunit
MTGVVIGSALSGMRPIISHQRVDFALLAMDQMVSQAANWHYMFGGKSNLPVVFRMIIGRGWGQGPQHAQSLQAWFAHIPGLKVLMPATPYDAKGLLISAIEDNNPVVFLEYRWLHNIRGHVPQEIYRTPIGSARVARKGSDITIAATSYMVVEALRAAEWLEQEGVSAEVLDVRSLKPLDEETLLASVRKTGRLIAADTGWRTAGYAAELVARVTESAFDALKAAPRRISLPDVPSPSTPALAKYFYVRAPDLVMAVREQMGKSHLKGVSLPEPATPLDIPDPTFQGPF